ncbi:hypothetical protein CAP35_01100 [Chitinophagaceae bacterium IBVUCB1]|nr:hypothetical protein CAP35_01100 [Chitinophagaceae bacterium IBVUCB1]
MLFATSLFAQRGYNESCPKLYTGFSLGMENPNGFIGFNFDVPVTQRFSLGTGAGLSTWGLKAFGEGRVYFKDCNRGPAIGLGATYNTGLSTLSTTLPTTTGDRDVSLVFEPSTNAFVSLYYFWNIGRRGHRIHTNIGYSYRFTDPVYRITDGSELTSDGKTAIDVLAPGGFMVGFGMSFGVLR